MLFLGSTGLGLSIETFGFWTTLSFVAVILVGFAVDGLEEIAVAGLDNSLDD